MIESLELEEHVVELYDAPKLLVAWSSPWHEFVTSIRPALLRSERRLAGEAPFGLIPLRIMIPSYVLEAVFIVALVLVQVKIEQLRPFVAPRFSSRDVIYYSGEELPRTQDLGGTEAGTNGRAGGGEAHHRAQSIKIARGGSLVPKVVDAPNLKLPSSRDAVANLLAVKPNPGPPPSAGLKSTRTAPNFAAPLIAPAPNVIRDYTRNGIRLESVIAPAPSVSRDRPLTAAPNLTASLIPPAPTVSRDRALIAPALGPAVIPPAPNVSRDHPSTSPSLNPSVVAPAPNISRDRTRSSPELAANVIAPASGTVRREFSSLPVQMNATVVPPPVSAPERITARNPKLNLPAPSVVAPPPSADVSLNIERYSGNAPDPSKVVVPPPPTQSGSGSLMTSLMGRIFGATEVVAPPPSVHSNGPTGSNGTSLAANVVPPPPTVSAPAGDSPGTRKGMGSALGPNVVAPPPSTGLSGGTSTRSISSSSAPTLGVPNVVAPPPSISGSGGVSRGTLPANDIVPPPPSVGRGVAPSGSGLARQGAGLGAPLDAGLGLVQPNSGGSVAKSGVLMSNQPGSRVGQPTTGGTGSLAMSPSGGDKPGLGGAGGADSIGRGSGPGSGMNGAGTGAAKTAAGRGSDVNVRGGISPTPGPGGAGNAPSGTPAARGVDISGGSGIVTIPGFGTDSPDHISQTPGHTAKPPRQALGVTVVATATSGGAFEPYKNLLRGEKYTTYFDTSLGTVVMEFADEAAAGHPYGGTLTAPTAMRTDLAVSSARARMVVTCILDASGDLKNVRVLEAGPAEMTSKVLSALRSWKFQPALRGNQPVEVTAILGFGIDTNDRF